MKQQQNKTSYERNSTAYIEGNTVRELETVPNPRIRETQEELEKKQEYDREREVRQRQARLIAKKNQEKAMQMNLGYVAFLLVAVIAVAVVCSVYLQLHSEMKQRMGVIGALEGQVLDLQTDNDATQKRINTSVNMNSIKQKAMNELGMVYPTEGQIIYFQIEDIDYMNQYEDIPEK